MKKLCVTVSLCAVVLLCGCKIKLGAWAAYLKLDKVEYAPGESIEVKFKAPAGLPDNAWVGIIPSDVPHGSEAENDKFDLTYQYLNGRTSGTLTFNAPSRPGSYDLRMHDTDSNGTEIASVSFKVVGPPPPDYTGQASLETDKTEYAPGERIEVSFKAPEGLPPDAWVGIIPASVPHGSERENDHYDVSYQYLKGRTSGTLVFNAPAKAGEWTVRMHDTDAGGSEMASAAFSVLEGAEAVPPQGASLETDRKSYRPGSKIIVSFAAPPGLSENGWIGVVPSFVPHGSEAEDDLFDMGYQYLKMRTSGVMIFDAPTQPGSYDMRMHDSDNNGREIASATFEVSKAEDPIDRVIRLELDKLNYAPRETIRVSFKAPEGLSPDAWVGMIPSDVLHGIESLNDTYDMAYQYLNGQGEGVFEFEAPVERGSYDMRLNDTDADGIELYSITFYVL